MVSTGASKASAFNTYLHSYDFMLLMCTVMELDNVFGCVCVCSNR